MNLRDKLKAIEKPKVKVTVTPTQPEAQPAFTDCWRTESTHAPSEYPIRRETVMLMQGDDMPADFSCDRIGFCRKQRRAVFPQRCRADDDHDAKGQSGGHGACQTAYKMDKICVFHIKN